MIDFTGERIVPGAENCEPLFAEKMYTEHSARYLLAAQLANGARILDVGCGVGYGAQILARAGAREVVAFDLSAEAIAHARAVYAHPVLQFHVRDATDFFFDGGFDLVTCFELIEHVPDQEAVFRCIKAVLAPGGVVVMSTPRALARPRNEYHTHEYALDEFRAAFARHFRHQRMLFENNHFTSLVTDGPPEMLDRIHTLHPQFDLDQADYFIGFGTDGDPASLALPRPVMVMNNEAYVKLLERDEAILQARRIELDAEVAALRSRLGDTEERLSEASHLEKRVVASLQTELARIEDQSLRPMAVDLEERVVASLATELARIEDQSLRPMAADLEKRVLASLGTELARIEHQSLRPMAADLEKRVLATLGAELARIESQSLRPMAADLERRVMASLDSATARIEDQSRHAMAAVLGAQDALVERLTRKRRFSGKQLKAFLRGAQENARDALRPPTRRFRAWSRRLRGKVPESTSVAPAAPVPVIEPSVPLPPGASFDVIFAIGCWEGESRRYRVHNVAEALVNSGRSVEVIDFSHLGRIVDERLRPKLVVLMRSADEPRTDRYFAYAREHGIRTIFDVDDLVFEPGLVERVNGYHMLSPERRAEYHDGVRRYRALLLKCDAVTVTTEALAEAVTALGKKAHVVPNGWNHIQSDIAKTLVAQARPAWNEILIGYFSGSRTHDRDFQEAAPALLRLMAERAEIRLRLVGELDPGPGFARFADRIERLPFLPYQDMLKRLHECDISIAPLEPQNPFNEAKSELKWFEAALVRVPTIVSPTAPFRAAIRHGKTGFLAATESEWYDALQSLAKDKALRARVGRAAEVAARAAFGPDSVLRAAEAAYGLTAPAAPVVRQGSGKRRIDWIVPDLIIGGGGHRNILRAAHFLEKFGHDVGLVFTNTGKSSDELRALLHQHFYPFDGPVRRFDHVFRYSDALFATHWSTVQPALDARGLTRQVMYFVQDFEPLFAPMGTEYILAENTYRQGLYCITSGPWCEHILRRDFAAEADHFEFPIDREVYFPRARKKENLNVLYFAKPEMPRRCYELGVMMLRELHRLMPEVEIILYGSKNVDLGALGFPANLQGMLPTIQDLAQAYSNADLGIVFSTTNPSLVPYEMMACGTPVVDLGRPGNEVNYKGRFDAALLADPQPAVMARQVRDLLLSSAGRAARSRAGLELVAGMPTEEQMARRVEELILRRLDRVS